MENKGINKHSRKLYRFLIIVSTLLVVIAIAAIYFIRKDGSETINSKEVYTNLPDGSEDPDRIVDGIHIRTGLVEAEGLTEVVNNCTTCHSAQLVIQNRMDKERWISTIRWMQKTQNLWDLGKNEEIIVNYLVTNYPPINKGRRAVLANIDWYELKE